MKELDIPNWTKLWEEVIEKLKVVIQRLKEEFAVYVFFWPYSFLSDFFQERS